MNKTILVEGKGDQAFIQALLKKMGRTDIECLPPKLQEQGTKGNGIDNVIKYIPVLFTRIQGRKISQAAILVDADYSSIENSGFDARRMQITQALAEHGYIIPVLISESLTAGEIFYHPDHPVPVGLFIMPNHCEDGLLENILKKMIASTHQDLSDHAVQSITTLPQTLFAAHRKVKAEMHTFMAWQKEPAMWLSDGIKENIFDINPSACNDLVQWLTTVFKEEGNV